MHAEFLQGIQGKTAFLRLHGETVVLLNQINFSHIQGLRTCLCYMISSSGETLPTGCERSTTREEPQFLKIAINLYGEQIKSQISCDKFVERMLTDRIREQWPMMRIEMALMRPKIHSFADHSYTLTEQGLSLSPRYLPANLDYLISRQIEHPIQELPWKRSLPARRLPPLSTTEVRKALDVYFSETAGKCVDIVNRVLRDYDPLRERTDGIRQDKYSGTTPQELCRALLGPEPMTPFGARASLARDLWMVLNELYFWRRGTFRAKHRDSYLELIQNNPLLVAVSSESPTNAELVGILEILETNALERLNTSRTQLENGDFIPLMSHTPAFVYTRARWRKTGLPQEDLSAIEAGVKAEISLLGTYRLTLEGAGTVALIMTCASPWGRGLAWLTVLKSSCMAFAGIPLNAYYLYDSLSSYDQTFRIFFSHFEANQAAGSAIQMQQQEGENIALNAALLPVGLGLVSAKESAAALMKIFRR